MEFPYKTDKLWKQYLLPESKIHGARFSIPLLIDLINTYTREGDFILDPMAGIGSIFVALTLKRNVYGIELEKRFADIARLNIQHIEKHYDTNRAIGIIIQADTRRVLPLPVHIDCIITSPPYGSSKHQLSKHDQEVLEAIFGSLGESYTVGKANPAQLGNMSYQMQRWEMDKIYRKCYEQLKPKGLLITVTKDQIIDGKRVEIGKGTIKACLDAGFILKEKHTRLCHVTGMQRLHMKEEGYKPITKEDVFCFHKV